MLDSRTIRTYSAISLHDLVELITQMGSTDTEILIKDSWPDEETGEMTMQVLVLRRKND